MKQFVKWAASSLLIVASLFVTSVLLSCGGNKGNGNTPQTQSGDPSLRLKELKYENDVLTKPYKITVDKDNLAKTDFKAKFDYGSKIDEEIPIDDIKLPTGQSKLVEGENIITLKVNAKKGIHDSTSIPITVTKKGNGGGGGGEPKSYKVTFAVNPADKGVISAKIKDEGTEVKSNETLVEEGKVVEVTFTISDGTLVFDGWECTDTQIKKDKNVELKASFVMPSKHTTVTARLRAKNEDPSLNLTELYDGYDLLDKPYSITVPNNITTIEKGRFRAIFDYGDKTNEHIPFDSLELENNAAELKIGENTVTLRINAKQGSYKAFSLPISVKRKGLELTLKELKFKGKVIDNSYGFYLLTVANKVTTLNKILFEAKFDYGDKTDEHIPFDALELENNASELKIGNNTVTLRINAKSGFYEAFSLPITVMRRGIGAIEVKIKRTEDSDAIKVTERVTLKTSGSQTDVIVSSATKMTSVIIGGTAANLNSEGTMASAKVGTGTITIKVTFAEYGDANLSFTLEKLTSGEKLPVTCTSASIDGNKLEFDSNLVASLELANIEYSSVKVKMTFDTPITDRTVKCKDERSDNYSTDPTEKDMQGIYSGYVVKTVDESGREEVLNPIENNEYAEEFIVGAGRVEYDITFTAPNRKTTTYKIKITNKNEKKNLLKIENGQINLPFLRVYDATGDYGFYANWKEFLALELYHKGPLLKVDSNGNSNGYNTDAFKEELEVMDNLKMTLEYTYANDQYSGTAYFYSTVYESNNRHEFKKRVAKHYDLGSYDVTESIPIREDVAGKYFDGFFAIKDYLPQGLHPFYTNKKWNKLVDYGFLANVYSSNNKRLFFNSPFNYRQQMYYIKNAQTAGESNSTELKASKKMTWTDWTWGSKEESLKGGQPMHILDGSKNGDHLQLLLTFTPDFSEKVFFTVYTSTDGSSWTVDNNCNNKQTSILQTRDGNNTICPGVPKLGQNDSFNPDTIYRFKEKNSQNQGMVYKIELKVEKAGQNYKYIYVLDYRDGQEAIEIQPKNVVGKSSDLFGLPTSYNSLRESEMKWNDLLDCEKISLERWITAR